MRTWLAALLIAAAVAVAGGAAPASAADQRWLMVSDVHFSPFVGTTSADIAKLQAAPCWRPACARCAGPSRARRSSR